MVISESHSFIFLAVPKTGTSALEHALARYASPLTDRFNKHVTCARLRRELPPAMWRDYFKFAFVRNPYDMMQSWYFYRQRAELADPAHPRHHLYTGNTGFQDFIEHFAHQDWMLNQFAWVAPPALGGAIQLDFVGRYETLDADYRFICGRLGIPCRPLPVRRASRNHAGITGLWNRHTRRLINDYFRRDFELFGYEMLID
jgi:hypothetical protein